MSERSPTMLVAPPRVSFSHHNQVAAPHNVHFPQEDAGVGGGGGSVRPLEDPPGGISSPGGRDRTHIQPINSTGGPISSVSKANLRSYHPGAGTPGGAGRSVSRGGGYYSYQHSRDHGGGSSRAAHGGSGISTGGVGSISSKHGSPTQRAHTVLGGSSNTVYDFSQRVILNSHHNRATVPAEYADAPNTDYIYEAILGTNNTSINNRINNRINNINFRVSNISNRISNNINSYNSTTSPKKPHLSSPGPSTTTMQGTKGAGGGSRRPASKPSPVHRASASPLHSEPGAACDGSVTSSTTGTGGPRYRSRRPVSTKVVQVGSKSLPPPGAASGAAAGGSRGKHGGLHRGVPHGRHRGVDGFFPPVKLRDNSFFAADIKRKRAEMQTPPFVLELAPEEAVLWAGDNNIPTGGLRAPSAKSSIARSSNPTAASSSSTSCHTHQYALSMTLPVYPHVASDPSCDDLTSMPPPRMMVSRGELPWVFRHKVKRSMNELSKIMASRPPQSVDAMGAFGYHYEHKL